MVGAIDPDGNSVHNDCIVGSGHGKATSDHAFTSFLWSKNYLHPTRTQAVYITASQGSVIVHAHNSHTHTLTNNYLLLTLLYSHMHSAPLQKKAVAAGPAAGGDTDDLQARLDQLRRGDDD